MISSTYKCDRLNAGGTNMVTTVTDGHPTVTDQERSQAELMESVTSNNRPHRDRGDHCDRVLEQPTAVKHGEGNDATRPEAQA